MGLFSKEKKVPDTKKVEAPRPNEQINWRDCPLPLKPLLNRILILEYKPAEVTRSGLILPAGAQETMKEMRLGRVIAVGPGKDNPTDIKETVAIKHVKVGDVVAFEEYKGMKFMKEKVDFRIIWDSELLGIIEDYDTEVQYA